MKKNFLYQIIKLIISYLLSLLSTMYVARVLHPEALGQLNFVETAIGYFVILAHLGLPMYGLRKTAEYRFDKEKLSAFVKQLLLMNIILAVVTTAVLFVLTIFIPRFYEDRTLFFILMWQIILDALTCEWFYKGTESFKVIALRDICTKFISLICIVVMVNSEKDIFIYAFIVLFTNALIAAFNLGGSGKFVAWRGKVSVQDSLSHLKPSLPFFLMACAVTIYSHIDVFMLGFMSDDYSIGCYGIATKIKGLLITASGLLWTVALPKATRSWKRGDKSGFEALGKKSISYILWLQIPVSFFSFIMAQFMIEFIGGAEYVPGLWALRILILSIVPIAVSNIIGGQILIPSNGERKLLAAEIVGALIDLVFNFFFITRWGISGAALSTLMAEIYVTAYTMYVARKELGLRLFEIPSVGKQSISALITGIILWGVLGYFKSLSTLIVLIISAILFFVVDVAILFVLKDPVTKTIYFDCLKILMAFIRRYRRIKYVVGPSVDESRKDGLFFCPCCKNYVKKMVYDNYHWFTRGFNKDLYLPEKREVDCPQCGSFPRHRILMWYFMENADAVKQYENILYFACEGCIQSWLKDNKIKYTTADLFAEADLNIDIEDTGLDDDKYDLIVCNHVLEHVNDFKKALREVHRILRKDGLFICSFPIRDSLETYIEDTSGELTDEDRKRRFGQRDHVRVFGADSKELLASAGFDVTIYGPDDCPKYIMTEDGPADYDKSCMFICRKV